VSGLWPRKENAHRYLADRSGHNSAFPTAHRHIVIQALTRRCARAPSASSELAAPPI
jgi:hypothetical protein